MVTLIQDAVVKKLKEVARAYRQQGYKVIVFPDRSQRPKFLRDFETDLIATKRGDKVVVEVKATGSGSDRIIERLAASMEGQKAWRFELVVAGSTHGGRAMTDSATRSTVGPVKSGSARDVQQLIRNAKELDRKGYHDAGLLIAWAALEATLRAVLERESLTPAGFAPPRELVQIAYTNGLMNKRDYSSLIAAMRERNLLSHGYRPVGESKPKTKTVLKLIESLRAYL